MNVSGPLAWTGFIFGSSMTGTGTTNANGGLTIGGAGDTTLAGGRVLNVAAGATWSGTGNFHMGGGAELNNLAGSTFTAQTDRSVALETGGRRSTTPARSSGPPRPGPSLPSPSPSTTPAVSRFAPAPST